MSVESLAFLGLDPPVVVAVSFLLTIFYCERGVLHCCKKEFDSLLTALALDIHEAISRSSRAHRPRDHCVADDAFACALALRS